MYASEEVGLDITPVNFCIHGHALVYETPVNS